MSISELPVKTMVKVLAKLRGGEIGFDPFRDDRTKTKQALLSFILANHSNQEIIAAVSSVESEANAPVGKRHESWCHDVHDIDNSVCKLAIPVTSPAHAPALPPIADPRLAALQALLQPQGMTPEEVKAYARSASAETVQALADILQANIKTKLATYDDKITAITNRKPVVERVEVVQAGKPDVVLKERVNPAFHEVLAMSAHYPNIMLVGPAGCGKTHLAAQVARALGKSFATMSCTAGTPESAFIGRLLPTGEGGKFEYMSSLFLDEYEKDDGCYLIDESDALDPNTKMVANGATANGGFHVDIRKAAGLDTHVKRGARSLLLASANTHGQGADAMYAARFQQDAAAEDRWYYIPVEYDRDLEASLAPEHLCEWVWALREKVAASKLRRVVSTRMLQKANAAHNAGRPLKEIHTRLLSGWTREELAKVGV